MQRVLIATSQRHLTVEMQKQAIHKREKLKRRASWQLVFISTYTIRDEDAMTHPGLSDS